MKLWRRRPLSVDLTDKNLSASNEMPPSLVYISPGIHNISKRSSLNSNGIIIKPQYFSEVSSFNPTETSISTAKATTVESCPLQSFRDYNNTSTIFFEDGTIRSSRLSNKSYLSPVSAEWLPVKDVMKIKRSASVPFHSQQNSKTNAQPIIESPTVNVKSHSSLADKIRTLFRTRSSSRSSKPVLTPITECKTNKGKVCLRNSRTRTKDAEACKSMYETSRVQNSEFSEKLNHILRDGATRPIDPSHDISQRKMHLEYQKSNKKKDKLLNDKKQKYKDYQMHWDGQRMSSSKGFSESVVSHTASSAAKCKSSPPKQINQQRLRSSIIYRPNENQFDKKPIVKSNSCKYEIPVSRDLFQSITSTPTATTATVTTAMLNNDQKNCDLSKSDSPNLKSTGKSDNDKILIQRRLSNQSITATGLSTDRPNLFERTVSIQRPEEDDYVTLAEVDLQLASPYSFMAQSMHGSIIRELEKSNHDYENIDARNFHSGGNNKSQSSVTFKCVNSTREKPPNSGSSNQKPRPISCIAVVDSEQSNALHCTNRYSSREPPRNMNPKSPYLSQYTKLYSLKVTNGEIMYQPHVEPLDCEIMTRSQTACPYRTPSLLGKETTGKRSIDSGLVDDLSINFHADSIMQT